MSANKTQQLRQYRRLLSYTSRYKFYFAVSFFGFLLFATMETALLQTIELFVNALNKEPTEWLDAYIPPEFSSEIWFVPITVIILAIFRAIGFYLGNYYMSRVGLHVVNALRKEVFEHLLYLPQHYFDKHNSSSLVSLIIYNIEQVTGSVTRAVKVLFNDGILLIVLMAVLLWKNWQLTLAFVVVTPILAALVLVAARYFKKVSRKIQHSVGQITHVTKEAIQGIKVVKSYRGESFEKERFDEAADKNFEYSLKFERVNALQTPVMHTVIACALATIFFLVLLLWPANDAAGAITYVTIAGMISKPFRQLSSITAIIQKGMAAAETIFAAIDEAPEPDKGATELENVQGAIEFKNVSFAYADDATVLKNISFRVEPGETVALVGKSGSGKTTIASLLLRFYNATEGEITLDGTPIESLKLNQLRQYVGLVNQMTVLFNTSVEENVTYGADSTETKALQHALEKAYAKNFVDQLDEGSSTLVGEDGDRLSGGQRQRIAIARALYKNSPVLILDEATSALDNESEKQIQLGLEELKAGRTTLVIAHRLSTVQNADKIIVLDQGDIVEMGDHQSLLARDGYYAKLYHSEPE